MSEKIINKENLYIYNNSLISISIISEDGNFRYTKYLMRMENLEQTLLFKNCLIPISQFTELKESLFYIRNAEEINQNKENFDFEDVVPNENENHDSNIINYNQTFYLQHTITNKYISLAKLTGNNNYILKLSSDINMAVPFIFKRINETRAYQEFLTFNQTFYLGIFIKEKNQYFFVNNLEKKFQNLTSSFNNSIISIIESSIIKNSKIDNCKNNFDNYSYLSIDKFMKTKYRLVNQNCYVKEPEKIFPGQALNILFSNTYIYKDGIKHSNRNEKIQQLMLGAQISNKIANKNDNLNNEKEQLYESKNTTLFCGEIMSNDFYYDVNKGFIGYLSEITSKNNKNIKVTAVPYEEDLYKHVTNNCFWIVENEMFENKEKLTKDPIKIGANIRIKNVLLGLYLKIKKIDSNKNKDNEKDNIFRDFEYEFELVDKETLISNSFFFANFKLFHYNVTEEAEILEHDGKYSMKAIFKNNEELKYDNFDFNQMYRYFQPVCLKIDSNNKLIVKSDNNFLFNIKKVDVLESSQYIYIKRIIDNLNFLIKKTKKNALHIKNLIRLIAPNISYLTDYLMNLDYKFKDENYDINTPVENRQKLLVSYGLLSSILNIIESLTELVNEFEDIEKYKDNSLDYINFDEMDKYFVNDSYSTEKNVAINCTRKLLKNILIFLSYLSQGNEEIKQMIFMDLDIILNLAEKIFPFDRSVLLNFIFKLIEGSEILQEYVVGKCLNFGVLLKNPKIKEIYEKKQNKKYMKMDRILFYIETSHNYLYYYKKLLDLKKVKYRRPDIKIEIINHMQKVELESKTKSNYKVYLMNIIKRIKKIIKQNERPLYKLIKNKKKLLNKKNEEQSELITDDPIDKFEAKNKIILNKKIFDIKKNENDNLSKSIIDSKSNNNTVINLRSEEGLLLNGVYNSNSISNKLINDNKKTNIKNGDINSKKNSTLNDDIKPNIKIMLTKNLLKKSHKEKLKNGGPKNNKNALKGLFSFFRKLLGIPNDKDLNKKTDKNQDGLSKSDDNFNYLEGILKKFKDIKIFLEYFQLFDLNKSVFIHDLFFAELFGSYEQIKHNQTKLNYLINGKINKTNIIDGVHINKKNGLGPLFPFHLFNKFFPKIDKYKEIELKYNNNKTNDIPYIIDDMNDSEYSSEDEDTNTQNKFENNIYRLNENKKRKNNIAYPLRNFGYYKNITFKNDNNILRSNRNLRKSSKRPLRKSRILSAGFFDNPYYGKTINKHKINNMFTEIGQKKIEDDLTKLNGYLSILYSSYQFCINQYFDAICKLFQYMQDYYVNYENFDDLDSMHENLLFINTNLLSKIVFVNNEVLEKLYSKAKENPTLLEGVFDMENFYENPENLDIVATTKSSRSSTLINKDEDFLENETGYEFVKNSKEKYKFKKLNAEEFYLIKNLFYYCRKFDKIMYILDKINYFKFIKKSLKHDDNNIMNTEEESAISNSIYEKIENNEKNDKGYGNENDYLMVGFHNIINKLFMKRNEILTSYIRINDYKKLLYDSFKNKKEAKIQKFDSFRYNINKRSLYLMKLLTSYELNILFGKIVYIEGNDPPFFTENSNILVNIKNIQRSFKEIKDEVKRIKINYDNKDNELMLLNTTFFNDAHFYFQKSEENREIGAYTKEYSTIHFQILNSILNQMTNKFLDFFRINAKGYSQLPKLNKMLNKENKNFYKKIGFDKAIIKLVESIDYYCDFENHPNGKLVFCREILRIFMDIKNLYLNFKEMIPENFDLYHKMIMKSLDTVTQYPENKIGNLEEKIFLHISYYSFQAFMLIIYNSMKNFEELRSYMIDIFTIFLRIYNKYKNPRNKVIFQILYTYYISRVLVYINLDIYYNDFSYDSFYKIIYPTETMHIRIITCINEILQDDDTNEETALSEKDEEEDEDEDDSNPLDKETKKSVSTSNSNKNINNINDNNINNINDNNDTQNKVILEEINTDISINSNKNKKNNMNNKFEGFNNDDYYKTKNNFDELNTNLNINDLLNQNTFSQNIFNSKTSSQNNLNNNIKINVNNNYQNKILSTWNNEEEKDKLIFYLNFLSIYVLFLHDKNSLKKILGEINLVENESLSDYDFTNLYLKIEKLLNNTVNINSYFNEQKSLNINLNKDPLNKKLIKEDINKKEEYQIKNLPKQLQEKISEILQNKKIDSQMDNIVIPTQKENLQFGNVINNFLFESVIIESIIYYRLATKETSVEIPIKNKKIKKSNKSDEESFCNSNNSSSNTNKLKNDNKVIFYYYDNEYIDLILFEKIINDINVEDNMLYYCIKEDGEKIQNSDFLKLVLSMQKEYKLIDSYCKEEYKILHDQYINNDMKDFINSLSNSYTQKDFEKIEAMQNFLYKRMNKIYYDDIEETNYLRKKTNISFIEQLSLIENKKNKAYTLENGINLFTFFHSLVYLYPEYNKNTAILLYKIGFKLLNEKYSSQEEESMRISYKNSRSHLYDEINIFSEKNLGLILDGLIKLFSRKLNQVIIEDESIFLIICGSLSIFLKKMKTNSFFLSNNCEMIRSFFFKLNFVFDHLSKDFNKIVNFMKSGENQKNKKKYLKMENKLKCMLVFLMTFLGIKKDGDDIILTKNIIEFIKNITGQIIKLILILLEMGKPESMKTVDLLLNYIYYFIQGLDIENLNSLFEFHFFDLVTFIIINIDYHKLFLNNINKINLHEILDSYAIIEQKILKIFFVYYNVSHNDVKNIDGYLKIRKWYEDNYINAKKKLKRLYYLSKIETENQECNINKSLIFFKSNDYYTDEELLMREGLINTSELNTKSFEENLNKTLNEYITEYNTEINTTDLEEKQTLMQKIDNKNKSSNYLIKFDLLIAYYTLNVYYKDLINEKYFHVVPIKPGFFKKIFLFFKKLFLVILSLILCIYDCFYYFYKLINKKEKAKVDLLQEFNEIESNYQNISDEEMFLFLSSHIKCVEVVIDRILFKIYFPIINKAKKIEENSEYYLHVDSNDLPNYVSYLISHYDDIRIRVSQDYMIDKVASIPIINILFKNIKFFSIIVLLLSIITNFIILASYSNFTDDTPCDKNFSQDKRRLYCPRFLFNEKNDYNKVYYILDCLGVILFILQIIIFTDYVCRNFSYYWVKSKINYKIKKSTKTGKKHNISINFMEYIIYVLTKTIYKFISLRTIYYILSLIFLLLGIFIHPFFYGFSLLELVNSVDVMLSVLKAMYEPGRHILITLLMFIMLEYLFSLFALSIFTSHFPNLLDTKNFLKTFMRMFDQTFKQDGGIGTYLDQSLEPGYVPYIAKAYMGARFWFDLIFYLVILLLIFQMFLSIIIDYFNNTRENKENFEKQSNSECLICGLEREFLEKIYMNGKYAFEKHVFYVHNIKNYVNYLIYIQALSYRDPIIEESVWNLHLMRLNTYLPKNTCLQLKEKKIFEKIRNINNKKDNDEKE